MINDRIVAKLPVDLADELEGSGQAGRLPLLRSDLSIIPVIALDAVQVATTLISIAQGPATVRDLAQMIASWWERHHSIPSQALTTVSAEGPSGRATLKLTGTVPIDDTAQLLAIAITPRIEDSKGKNASATKLERTTESL